ncbi:MAG: sulfatase [Thermoguttaceae bacterium]
MTRFLLRTGGLFASLLLLATTVMADDRPNILFCIADDWGGGPHAGVLGDPIVKTPTFDRLARDGVLFPYTYVPAPSCTPCRGGILTGQIPHRLEEGGNLWSRLPAKFKCYPALLEQAGYTIGLERKGWGPGTLRDTGRTRNPAGPSFKNFEAFLETVPEGKPFCFWAGTSDPHRGYAKGSGIAAGMDPEDIDMPAWLPDTPEVRSDILDYYVEVQRFDRDIGQRIALLEKTGKLDNTLVIMTGDHGMPFPRGKCNLYDSGSQVPFVVSWPSQVKGGRVVDDFISFTDIAPTFLQAAGLEPLAEMTGRSFLDVLKSGKSGRVDATRDKVFVERERHTVCRPDAQSYPSRMIRTYEFLYIRNLRPHLWPAGDPEVYRDIDGSPSKSEVVDRRNEPAIAPFFDLACAKRPAEELYDLSKDPQQIDNVAGRPQYADVQKQLRAELDRWMIETDDPRAKGETDFFDKVQYVGGGGPKTRPPKK